MRISTALQCHVVRCSRQSTFGIKPHLSSERLAVVTLATRKQNTLNLATKSRKEVREI